MTYGEIDRASSWDDEYRDKGIPSSWKEAPSSVVLWALDGLKWLNRSVGPEDRVLDVGCGTGRNSISVADLTGCSVAGFDYSKAAVANASTRLDQVDGPLRNRVTFQRQDMRSSLPVEDHSVSLVLDVFVYFHLLDATDRARYRAELRRVLRPGSTLLLSLAPSDDAFYAQCPEQAEWRERSVVPVVLDVHAGVGNILHTLASLVDELSEDFELLMAWRKINEGPMHGSSYRRVTLATLWQPLIY